MTLQIAVITPFHKPNPAWLAQCHASVRAQTHPCTHILVSDGAGPPPLTDFSGQVILLDRRHEDIGNTPRAIGWMSAIAQKFDAVAFLDDDNWFHAHHIRSLIEAQERTGIPICTSRMELYDTAGNPLGPDTMTDGVHHVDTSCYLITRPAFGVVASWTLMPERFRACGDSWFWHWLKMRNFKTHDSGLYTVCYRTTWPAHYKRHHKPVPPDAKSEAYQAEQSKRIAALKHYFSRLQRGSA